MQTFKWLYCGNIAPITGDFVVEQIENECEDCGASWDDPNHQTRQATCDDCGADCGYKLCAEDHSHILCDDCSKESYD